MCRTVHALLQVVICGIQMLVRVFMTIILMIENLIRMILQTLYNFISFMMQMISLIPICVVFLLTARLKCFMCGGGGPCPVNRGGACDCLMSAMAIVILLLIFRATGVLDKIFYKLGYVKARPLAFTRFVPTPGDITECSRNDTDYDETKTRVTEESVIDKIPETITRTYSEGASKEETADTDKLADVESTSEEDTADTIKPIDAGVSSTEDEDDVKQTDAEVSSEEGTADTVKSSEETISVTVKSSSKVTTPNESDYEVQGDIRPTDAVKSTDTEETTKQGRRRIPTRSFTTVVEYSDYPINTKDPDTNMAYNSNWTTVLYYLV